MVGRSEKAEMNDALVALSALPKSLFYRNNSGKGWVGLLLRAAVGSTIRVEPGMVILRNARPITFGLPGSGDIMGAHDEIPVAVEMKSEDGRQEVSQVNFQKAWTAAGGAYIIARSARDAVDGVLRAVQRVKLSRLLGTD